MYKKYRKRKKIVNVSKLYNFISQSLDHESPETECKFLLCAFLRGVKSPQFSSDSQMQSMTQKR